VPFPKLFDDFIFERYFHLLGVQTGEASLLDVPAVIAVTPGSGFARKGVCVLAVDVEEVLSDRLLGQTVIGERFPCLVCAVLRGPIELVGCVFRHAYRRLDALLDRVGSARPGHPEECGALAQELLRTDVQGHVLLLSLEAAAGVEATLPIL
jgi:hypothetical protein